MKVRKSQVIPALALISVLAALLGVFGALTSGESKRDRPGSAPSTGAPAGPPDVIHLGGLHGLEFGASEAELTRQGLLMPPSMACGPRLANLATVSPVFADDRLVLLWASPPMHTPEGVAVGTPVDTVRRTYPDVTALDAPRGSHRFDGLLASEGDRAYLFLHDDRRVRKIIAGYAEYARKLFDEGFGTC